MTARNAAAPTGTARADVYSNGRNAFGLGHVDDVVDLRLKGNMGEK